MSIAAEGGQGSRAGAEERCRATHTVMKGSSEPCTGKAARLGLAGKEGIFGVLGRYLSPAEQSWDKGQSLPSQAQPHSSWVPQIRQAPNVSSCWAGKMIPNNSSINRLQRGGTEQDGARWPLPLDRSQNMFST